MTAALQTINIRLPVDLVRRLEEVRKRLYKQLPGATRTDAVKMVLQRGLDNFEEDKIWMNSDLSRLGEFDPYDFGDADPTSIGRPVLFQANGSFTVEKNG